MTVHNQQFEPTAPDDDLDALEAALSEGHALRRLAMIEEMAEGGMVVMRDLRRLTEAAQEAPASEDDLAAAEERARTYGRLTRSMRLNLALDAKMREDLRRRMDPPEEAEDDHASRWSDKGYDDPAKTPIMRAYGDVMARNAVNAILNGAIDDQIADKGEVERLKVDLYERLYDSEDYRILVDEWRDLGRVLEAICQDLGVELELSQWKSESWAMGALASRPVRPPGARHTAPPEWSLDLRDRSPRGRRDQDHPPPDG